MASFLLIVTNRKLRLPLYVTGMTYNKKRYRKNLRSNVSLDARPAGQKDREGQKSENKPGSQSIHDSVDPG